MQIVKSLERADLKLSFVNADATQARTLRDLQPGQVRLTARLDGHDEAVALAPQDAAEAREIGVALANLAGTVGAKNLHVAANGYAAALAGAASAAHWKDTRFRGVAFTAAETPQLHLEGLGDAEQARVQAVLAGMTFTRELVSAPANHLSPATLAREARTLERCGLDVDVLDTEEVKARGMNLLAAVAAGSKDGPRLIRVTLPARGECQKVVALVGKGITFDTGGYSLKTAQGMYGMKNDMGGAATVLGTMRALADLRELVPEGVEIRAYVAAAENMVGPDAMRPGDIYRAANGKTVEVTNTDAEGRLVLADALAVACDEGATELVDVATLTGAKITALGSDMAAVFSNDRDLVTRLQRAADAAGESIWELPLHQPYLRAYQKNTIADLKNSDGNPAGGSIKAALFLSQFVTRPWAHLDIAGNAAKEDVATGWGVGTLTEYVLNR
ncbi:leucyl aminopeptidase family protein [Deinococcus cavernae]|uniref:Leucyl aminopeptidase family protein n=1 Tax=Deinococcus cavernae TaxID=2320857 RepID=A0A418V7V7_9DEIO|nr:leucyl aminopeptidase family protein [Deinococcus cavernae]RJF72169.1 leucyl aminopeptidase family protein [Deinococcus cavernae]